MKVTLEHFGIESLLFTSDSPYSTKDYGTTDGGTMIINVENFMSGF